LDLNSAYNQIGLSERSKPLTAFATDWNLYEYTRVPFRIATGAQVLTRLLDIVFRILNSGLYITIWMTWSFIVIPSRNT
jgi:hypothetical protein